MNHRTRSFLMSITTTLALALNAHAQIHAGDIVVRPNSTSTRVQTGLANSTTGQVTMGVRVFNATFGEAPNFTNDPGFDSGPDQWPVPSKIGFTIQSALRKWGGSNFNTVPPERIQVRLGPFGPILTPLTDTPVLGFSLAVSSDGEFHHHFGYTLLAPTSTGIYLFEATLWATVSGLAESKPFFIVFNQNGSVSDQNDAYTWVENNLLGCASDFDGDGFVTGDDFDAYVAAFEGGGLEADFDGDGFVTGDDFDAFVAAFESGC